MIDRLSSSAPSTLHVAFNRPAVSAIRPVPAVVERPRHEGKEVRGDHDTTTYTPRKHRLDDDHHMYSHKGTPATSSGVFAVASYEKSESLDLKVRTAEGDVVTLSFSDSDSATVSAGAVQTANGSAQAFSMSSSHSSDLQISVKGQLSEQERAAINALAAQASEVADDFFDGDMAAAMQEASKMDISGQADTLSAFSLRMESRETQIAAAMYENIAQATAPAASAALQTPATWDLPAASASPQSADATAPPPTSSGGKDLLKNLMALFERITGGVKGLASGSTPLNLSPLASSDALTATPKAASPSAAQA